jgi:hypothetical protein
LEQFAIFILSFLAAILLIIFITDSISSRVLRRVGPGVFASLVGVLVGVSVTIAWDAWKTSQERRIELLRAARDVDQENQTNLGLIANDLFALTNDDAAADKGCEVVTPPVMPLLTSAGETAYLRGSFEIYSTDLAVVVGNVNSFNYLINKRIEGRDFYRFTNQAMDNFGRRRKLINTELERILREQERLLKRLHMELVKAMK